MLQFWNDVDSLVFFIYFLPISADSRCRTFERPLQTKPISSLKQAGALFSQILYIYIYIFLFAVPRFFLARNLSRLSVYSSQLLFRLLGSWCATSLAHHTNLPLIRVRRIRRKVRAVINFFFVFFCFHKWCVMAGRIAGIWLCHDAVSKGSTVFGFIRLKLTVFFWLVSCSVRRVSSRYWQNCSVSYFSASWRGISESVETHK